VGFHDCTRVITVTYQYREGSVHGRFQPLHNGHLEYILAAKQRCAFLWIGITKYETTPESLTPLGLPREHPHNNPLTYFERIRTIGEALEDAGIPSSDFAFVPFPIETPEKLQMFLPVSVPCLTTICEPWNEKKIEVLTETGYLVEVLWRKEKTISGTRIRQMIISGQGEWKELVPKATVRMVETLDIAARLRHLHEHPATESSR
jgi:nicotinamide mononucleotide adenylyltransferase